MFPSQRGHDIEDCISAASRSARPLPRGFTGHVAHPVRSIGRSKSFGSYELQGKERNNEDTDNDSDIGVTAHGVRPDSGATTDAGADSVERNADYCAGEREEETSPGA